MTTLTWKEQIEAEKARVAALTTVEQNRNLDSHTIGIVDDCNRCLNCEIASWNAWKRYCGE